MLDSQSVASNIQRNQPSMVDMNLHVAPAGQGVGGGDLQELASSDDYLSAPKLNSRMDGEVGGEIFAALPQYTAQVRGISFPFRPGATFHKQFTGRHAAAVNKPRVTIEF